MSHLINSRDPKIWTPQTVSQDCMLTITNETNERGDSVPAKNPHRQLRRGDQITITGGSGSTYFFRLGDRSGEKVSALFSELHKVIVED